MNCTVPIRSNRRNLTLAFRFASALLMTLGLPEMSFANEPIFSGQAIIHNDAGALINPWSISKSDDGGFYVTGAMDRDGWAIKTDAKGDILWRYDLRESAAGLIRPDGVFIDAAVPAHNRETYLCASSHTQVATLVRLDRRGYELSRRALSPDPQDRGSGRYVSLGANCMQWGSNFVYIGDEKFNESYGLHQSGNDRFYWVIVFDQDGHIKKQWQIPVGVRWAARIAAYIDRDNLIFYKTDNTNTDLVQIDLSTNVVFKKEISGSVFAIQPLRTFSLFSFLLRPEVLLLRFRDGIFSLGKNLQEETKVAALPKNFTAIRAFHFTDGQYVFFGGHSNATNHWSTSGIAVLDAKLQESRIADFPGSIPLPYSDGGEIADVVGGYKHNQFVVLRKLIPKQTLLSSGVAIDFIEIK